MSVLSASPENPARELYAYESEPASDDYRIGRWLLCGVVAYGLYGQMAAVLTSAGLGVSSRMVTVPSRALMLGLSLMALVSLMLKPRKIAFNAALIGFLLFWIAFACRILLVAASRVDVNVEAGRFTLKFIATMAAGGVFIPALSILVNSCWEFSKYMRNTMFSFALGSGLATVMFYGNRFTNFENRMSAGDTEGGVVTINSLAIGYLGASLVVMASYIFICLKRRGFLGNFVGLLFGGLGLFLMVGSASRGPIVCSGATCVFLLATQARQFNVKRLVLLAAVILGAIIGVVTLAQLTGSTVIDRLLGIGYAIEHQSEGAARMDLYKMAASQISYSPVFGSSLTLRAEDGTDMYPHNLFLESMMATGLVGTVPLAFVMFCGFRSAWFILNRKPEMGWVALTFVLFFMYQMFGGAIYSSGQFWVSTAAVISCGTWVRRRVREEEAEAPA